MKYDILNQKHPDFNAADIERKRLLYAGGDDIIKEAALFIPANQGENPTAYVNRLSCASYVNYMSNIIDTFASNIFNKELTVLPAKTEKENAKPTDEPQEDFYSEFAEDADLAGNDFPNAMKRVYRQAMVTGTGFLGLDFPKLDQIPTNLLEEEQMGAARAYTYEVDESSVINWDLDDMGNYKWVVLKKEFPIQGSPFEQRENKKIQFKVWTLNEGVVKWELYELTTKMNNREPGAKTDVPVVDSGVTSFKQIPILRFSVSKGLWIGNKIGTLVADHFRMRSSLFYAQNRSMYAMPYYKQGAEYDSGGDLSVITEDDARGRKAAGVFASRGFAVIGPTDELGFAEPTGSCYELINTELKEHVDEIYRTVSQIAQSVTATSSGTARSGTSKQADNSAMERLLAEYGSLVRKFSQEVYACISEARSESIDWEAHGLSNYELLDKEALLAEAMAFSENMVNIPSMTFKKVHLTKLAQAFVPNAPVELQKIIEDEISEWCDSNEKDIMETANPLHEEQVALEQAKAAKPPPGVGAKPGAKKPPAKKK